MPRPIYIICHQMGTEDRETGLISLFFIIEKMQVAQLVLPPGAQRRCLFRHNRSASLQRG